MNGPEHYREAERLLAVANASTETTFEGHNPEADRTIAEAHVHALLAMTAAYALAQPIVEHPDSGGHMSQEHYEEWVQVVEIGTEGGVTTLGTEAKATALSAPPEAWARLGRELRERREALGLSRRALSEKADVSEKAIQIAEEGRVPSARWPQSITRIARALGWTAEAAAQIVLFERAPEVTR